MGKVSENYTGWLIEVGRPPDFTNIVAYKDGRARHVVASVYWPIHCGSMPPEQQREINILAAALDLLAACKQLTEAAKAAWVLIEEQAEWMTDESAEDIANDLRSGIQTSQAAIARAEGE